MFFQLIIGVPLFCFVCSYCEIVWVCCAVLWLPFSLCIYMYVYIYTHTCLEIGSICLFLICSFVLLVFVFPSMTVFSSSCCPPCSCFALVRFLVWSRFVFHVSYCSVQVDYCCHMFFRVLGWRLFPRFFFYDPHFPIVSVIFFRFSDDDSNDNDDVDDNDEDWV